MALIADHAKVIPAGYGSATVDGALGPGEWANAVTIALDIKRVDGSSAPGTLYLMNDTVNLYLAVTVDAAAPGNSASFEFDNDASGTVSDGDDGIIINPSLGFSDLVRQQVGHSLNSYVDTSLGGTNDGEGGFSNAGGRTIYEFSHPLDSPDDPYDFSLRPGDRIGFEFSIRLLDGKNGADTDAYHTYTLAKEFPVRNVTGTPHADAFIDLPGFKSTFWGKEGADVAWGMDRRDALHGGLGNDGLYGRAGDDTLYGGGGYDVLAGGAGNDQLFGARGTDVLNGGAGNDRLSGGRGNDVLTGGAGKDTFAFGALRDFGSLAAWDTVLDFDGAGGDKLDFSVVDADVTREGDQAFTFIGDAAFSGRAGELLYSIQAGGIIVSGDINGDATADFSLGIAGAGLLMASHCIL